jgi:hypothetical protein
LPLKDAARELAINYSTAKTILRIFRIEKRIEKKNADEERVLKKLIQDFKKDKSSNLQELRGNKQKYYLNLTKLEISTTTNSPEVAPRSLNEKSHDARLSLLKNLTRNNGDTSIKQNSNDIINLVKISSSTNNLNNINSDLSFLEIKLKNLNNDQERVSIFNKMLSIYQNDITSFSEQIFKNQVLLTRLMQVTSNMQHIIQDFNFNPPGKN